MLKKVKIGSTLEDLVTVKAGIIGACGSRNQCNNCGASGNDRGLYDSYHQWEITDF